MSMEEREVEMRHATSVISIYRPADQCIKFLAVALLTLTCKNYLASTLDPDGQ